MDIRRILIADDDLALRNLLRLIGQRAGFAVDTASNGREAVEMMAANDYTVAMIDLMMPQMNGYEVIDRVAGMPKRPALIIVTAMSDSAIPQLDGDVVHTIVRKPFDVDIITGMLMELAGKEGEDAPLFPRPSARPMPVC